ncbi:hypothetical protein [Streptococcus sp. NLN64]|uniref:hypothetical protein n=1 Tax=Streptococcus sp. NLN64 TaxID=2822799 RepID=UPI0018C93355|nr:hypothetical protein [Streptococcus sp. NLN64]MBG9366509.1 hypothetical protein [Streptococcus sp. NLN64]
MNELEKTALNEILRTVTYIAEKVDKLEEQLFPNFTETDKKEVMSLIRAALSDGRGIVDTSLERAEIKSVSKGIEGIR